MRSPLSVRLSDGEVSRHVTDRVRGLRFTKSAYGGDVDLACVVQVPRGMFTDLGPGDTIEVFDGRLGESVWSGNTDNPGVTVGPAGEAYDLQAFGAAARLQAATTPLGYVVTSLDIFARSANSTKGAQTSNDERPDGSPSLVISANDGKTVTAQWQGEFLTRAFKRAGLEIARVRAQVDSGLDAANYQIQIRVGSSADDLAVVQTDNARTTANLIGAYRGDTQWTRTNSDLAAFRVVRNTSQVQATDDHWFEIWETVVRQTLVGRNGNEVSSTTGNYESNNIRAHQVILDMIGRGMAPGVDPNLVTVPETTYPIDALDWLDGISMGDALEQLRTFEPGLWWLASGASFRSGLFSDADPRYVISKRHGGISSPGEEFALCNRVAVSWTDRRGREQTTIVRRTVAGLDYTRDAEPVTLPEGLGSEANARRAGEQILDLTADPPRAGTAIIRERIRDEWQGCDVLPHEIEPGCRVMEQETGDVLRLTEVEYVDADGAATLTLGEPARTVDQQITRIARRQRRRRRRR